jgi:hypothetical protein
MRCRTTLASLLVAALGVASCGGDAVTAARVVVTLAPGVQADQLRLEVLVGGVPLTAADVPPAPGPAITSGTDLVVRFPDALGNQQATFLVASLAVGAQTGRGEGAATLVLGKTVTIEVTVAAAACPAAQHQCAGLCYPDQDLTHCGLACLTCPAPAAHGAAGCESGMCTTKCDAGYEVCDSDCVNLKNDPDHCGKCALACSASQVCSESACIPNPCASGKHLCGTDCVNDNEVTHCGRACEPCPNPSNGTATCDGTRCGASCQGGFHACGSQCLSNTSPASCGTRCAACPLPPNGHGTPGCDGTACTVSCDSDYHACNGDCVTDNDPAHCGTRCEPCPKPTNGSATCSGGACGVQCSSGFKPCQGSCVPSNQSCQATWTLKASSGPVGRTRPGLAYDSDRNVTVLFGGFDGLTALADTWEWNGSTWLQRSPATAPDARSAVAMTYDATRKRIVLFGGELTDLQVLDDTWLWNGTSWSDAGATGPEARAFGGAVWDSAFEQVTLFGGWNGSYALDDLWAWDGAEWSQVGISTESPGGRANFAMIYDASNDQTVVFGGSADRTGSGTPYGDTWLFQGSGWETPGLATAPSARVGSGFVYDSSRGIGVLFGGMGPPGTYLADTLAWNGAWATLATTGAPAARWRGGMVYDSTRDVVVYFGGAAPPSTYFGETWELSW